MSIDLITLDVSLLTVSKTAVVLVLVVSVDPFIAASVFYIVCTAFVCCIMLLNFWRPMIAFKQDGIFLGIFMGIGIYFSTHTLRFPVIGLISRLYHTRKCSRLFIFSKIISKKWFYHWSSKAQSFLVKHSWCLSFSLIDDCLDMLYIEDLVIYHLIIAKEIPARIRWIGEK